MKENAGLVLVVFEDFLKSEELLKLYERCGMKVDGNRLGSNGALFLDKAIQ